MNAYELADYVDAREINNPHLKEASAMLRQQAEELKACKIHERRGWEYAEELEKERRKQADRIAELDKQVGIFDAELMKARISNSLMKTDRDRLAKGHKELSDEEIISIRQITKPSSADNWADTLAFARAIEERHGIK